jgi:hypothetical protein
VEGCAALTDRHVVLHVSPHPDDEAIGAGMTLAALAARGWLVVNLLVSRGEPGQEARRLAESDAAARIAGYRLDVDSDIPRALRFYQPEIVICSQPHDGHPAHEAVGRAVRDALSDLAEPPPWWMWGLWADLAVPTLYIPFGEDDLARALEILTAYAGELARNDYRRVLRGRSSSNTVLGSERVFGFGSAGASDQPYAELLTEAIRKAGRWYAGRRRLVDLDRPLGDRAASSESLDDWISDRPS